MPTRAAGQRLDDRARALDQLEEALEVGEKAPLAGGGRRAAEAAAGIERRQQREPDAGRGARRGDPARHLAEVGVGPAVDVVMQVVELADRGEADLEHLHVGEGGDRLDVIGRKPGEEAIHHLAPGPEAVGGLATMLGKAGHAALERMAVQVGQARHGDTGEVLGAVARGAVGDRHDGAVSDREAHVARPAGGQQHMVEEQLAAHGGDSSAYGQ